MSGAGKSNRDNNHTDEATEVVKNLALSSYEQITSPVVIVAGGCDVNVKYQMEGYRQLLL